MKALRIAPGVYPSLHVSKASPKWNRVLFGASCALLASLSLVAGVCARSNPSDPLYVVRGHQVEARQHELKDRLDRFHDALSKQLRRDAPDLLAKIEPSPPIAFGYQILPRIIPDNPPQPAPKPHVVTFSWPASEALLAKEIAAVAKLESDLARISGQPSSSRRPGYESIVAAYCKALDRRRVIDADIDYNWLWQRQISSDRPLFDRLTARLNAAAANLSPPPSPAQGPSSASNGKEHAAPRIDPPAFARFDPPASNLHVITVPLYTDILDRRVVDTFERAVETYWHVSDGRNEYRIRLSITQISPESLYCPDAQKQSAAKPSPASEGAANVDPPPSSCAPPLRGAHINLESHAARFPADGAVLTTGAESLQLAGPRAIVLGPHDVAPRTLAHEFGHILGFPDAYLRGYQDLGADGFAVLEFVPDYADIMSSPGAGSILPRHFAALVEGKQVQALMQAGLDALYQQNDPAGAAARFREVLAINPDHYGATLQLAKALDRAGKTKEALPLWHKMLEMAEDSGDAETLQTVRARLAAAPQ